MASTMKQLELGRSIAAFLRGYRAVDTYMLLVQFSPDADRSFMAQLLGDMKAYQPVRVMMNTIVNRNNWTQSTSRSWVLKHPPKPLLHGTLTVLVVWTQGAGEDTARVVASFFGSWTNWHAEPHMCSDAGCSYA